MIWFSILIEESIIDFIYNALYIFSHLLKILFIFTKIKVNAALNPEYLSEFRNECEYK